MRTTHDPSNQTGRGTQVVQPGEYGSSGTGAGTHESQETETGSESDGVDGKTAGSTLAEDLGSLVF